MWHPLLIKSKIFQGINADNRNPQHQQQPPPQQQQGQYGRGPGGGQGGPGGYLDQGQNNNSDSYNGPDSLRNTANKMFNRNNNERSSGYNGQIQASQAYPNNYHYQQQQQPLNQSHHSLNQSLNHSLDMSNNYQGGGQGRMRESTAEDPTKRNSYGNQSFRNAIQSPPGQGPPPKPGSSGQQQPQQTHKLPPQVPPKPGSRSASKERTRDINNDENDHLENELKNILRGNHKESFDKTNGAGTKFFFLIQDNHIHCVLYWTDSGTNL